MENYINIEQYILDFKTLVFNMISRSKVDNIVFNRIMKKIKSWELKDKTNVKQNELCDLNHKILEEIIFFKYYCHRSQIDFTNDEEEFFKKLILLFMIIQ